MGREKFPTAKREQRERERLEKIELIFGIISICRNEGSLSSPSPPKKEKRKKESGGIPSTGYHHATPSPAPFINITIKRMRVTERRRRGEEEGERENDTTAGTINARIYIFHGTSNRRERFGEVSLGKNPFESISVSFSIRLFQRLFLIPHFCNNNNNNNNNEAG